VAQVLGELLYNFFIEILCFGTGYMILRPFGFGHLDQHAV